MPIYEYECPKCGKFEVVQKITDRPVKAKPDCPHADCPRCAKRLISAAAFHLKGTGWYKTDYGSSSSGVNGTSDSGAKDKKKKKETESTSTSTTTSPAKTSSPSD
jgi:putative FmdB family regulatory protein